MQFIIIGLRDNFENALFYSFCVTNLFFENTAFFTLSSVGKLRNFFCEEDWKYFLCSSHFIKTRSDDWHFQMNNSISSKIKKISLAWRIWEPSAIIKCEPLNLNVIGQLFAGSFWSSKKRIKWELISATNFLQRSCFRAFYWSVCFRQYEVTQKLNLIHVVDEKTLGKYLRQMNIKRTLLTALQASDKFIWN